MSFLNSCRFEFFCSGEKFLEHSQKILDLGFNIAKHQKDILSCEIINPTRDQINRFLDVVERMKNPVNNDYNNDEYIDSFVVPPKGSEIQQDFLTHVYGNREPEEGVEDIDEKSDSSAKEVESYPNIQKIEDSDYGGLPNEDSFQSVEIVSQDEVNELDVSRDQNSTLQDFENETRREMFENDDSQSSCENGFGQAEKLKYHRKNEEREKIDRAEKEEMHKHKVNSSQTGVETAQDKFYSDNSCHERMTQELLNPNTPCRVKENKRTKGCVQEENEPLKELKIHEQLKDEEKTEKNLEHEIHDVEFNATSEDLIPQNQAAENFTQYARDTSSGGDISGIEKPIPKPRGEANAKKAMEASKTKEEKTVVDMKDVRGEPPSNELCHNSSYERTPSNKHSTQTEDKCFGETNKDKKTRLHTMSLDSEEKKHQEVVNDHSTNNESLGRHTMKTSHEGTDDERTLKTIDNVQQINEGAIQGNERDELKAESVSSMSGTECEKNTNTKRSVSDSDDKRSDEDDQDESKLQGGDDLSLSKLDAKKKEHGNETDEDHVENDHKPEQEETVSKPQREAENKSKCHEITCDDHYHAAGDNDDYKFKQEEKESKRQRENDSLTSKSETERISKRHEVTRDDHYHVPADDNGDYKFKQKENELKHQGEKHSYISKSNVSHDDDDDDDDHSSATDDDDDKPEQEEKKSQPQREAGNKSKCHEVTCDDHYHAADNDDNDDYKFKQEEKESKRQRENDSLTSKSETERISKRHEVTRDDHYHVPADDNDDYKFKQKENELKHQGEKHSFISKSNVSHDDDDDDDHSSATDDDDDDKPEQEEKKSQPQREAGNKSKCHEVTRDDHYHAADNDDNDDYKFKQEEKESKHQRENDSLTSKSETERISMRHEVTRDDHYHVPADDNDDYKFKQKENESKHHGEIHSYISKSNLSHDDDDHHSSATDDDDDDDYKPEQEEKKSKPQREAGNKSKCHEVTRDGHYHAADNDDYKFKQEEKESKRQRENDSLTSKSETERISMRHEVTRDDHYHVPADDNDDYKFKQKENESKYQGEKHLFISKSNVSHDDDDDDDDHSSATDDDDDKPEQEEKKSKPQGELGNKSKCHEVTRDDHYLAADNDDYKFKQEEKESKHQGENDSLTSKSNVSHDDDDHSSATDDDDQYVSAAGEDDEEPKDENASFSNIPFEKGGYELALTFFANSKSLEYLRTPEIKNNSLMIVKVNDQQCTKELINFKRKLKKAKVTSDKHELLRRVKKRWESQIVAEHFSDHILLTAPKEIHAEIRNEFPDLYETETTHQLSASNISKEEAAYKKGMGANREEKERVTASAPPMPKDGFEGHHSKLTVKIEKTNITCLHVDVIVNAANYRLKNTGGVAKVIADAAGNKMIEECRKYIFKKSKVDVTQHFPSSGGGKLFAKEVYHAVGPKFSLYASRIDECKRDLRLTILRCLCHAEVEGYRSIAFPSISAAVFRVPREICVESYMKAVQHFEVMRKRHNVEKLEEVYFVDIDDSMVKAIKQHFVENWDRPVNTTDFEFRKDDLDMEEYFVRRRRGSKDGKASYAGMSGSSSYGVGSPNVGARPKSTSWISSISSTIFGASSSDDGAEPESTRSSKQTEKECGLCNWKRTEFKKCPSCDKVVCKNCHQKMQQCPFCLKIYGTLTGDQPKGHMLVVENQSIDLAGHKCKGCYVISYFFDEVSSLTPYRKAYIPATSDGLFTIKLLMLAFRRRLTFTKGRSVTTGAENQITWNDIHHKTSLVKGHAFGYPDDSYLKRVTDELKSKGVTKGSMTPDEKNVIKLCVKQLNESFEVKVFSDGL